MKTKPLLSLTAAALFALCAGSAVVASQEARDDATAGASSAAIVDLPTITVRPEAADLAYFQAHRIVDLAAITVRPEPQDMVVYLASNTSRVVDMPVVTVHPSSDDVRMVAAGALAMVQQLASR